jgi:hypothetical protein
LNERNVRVIRDRGSYVMRRPMAEPVPPETWRSYLRRDWPEIVFGAFVLLLCFAALIYAVPILVGQP